MNRSTLLLLAFLVVLGAIVLFVLPRDEEQIASYDRPPVTFRVDSASVVKLSIERGGKLLTVENVGGRWVISSHGGLAADPARVAEVVGGLSRFKPGSLVSTNPAKQGLFQLDSSGNTVTLTDRSGASTSIIIGKMGPSFSEVYFRIPGESNVYLGSGITTWSLERDVKDWRDRTIFASPAEAITGLDLSAGGRTREYRRDSTGWTSGNAAVSTESINPVITTLSNLRAEDFIDTDVQLSGTPSTVKVSGAVTATLEFYRIANDTGRYAVMTSGSPQKYIVGRFAATQLFKPVGDARPAGVAAVSKKAPAAEVASARDALSEQDEPAAPEVKPAPVREIAKPPVKDPVVEQPKQESKPAETKAPAPAPVQPPASSGTVNPFKQKSPTERSTQPPSSPPSQSTQGARETKPPATDARKPAEPSKPPVQSPSPAGSGTPPATKAPEQSKAPAGATGSDDEGELSVHVVKKGETMTTIAQKYGVTVDQILKWNLLKSISVKPGQELYIFLRK